MSRVMGKVLLVRDLLPGWLVVLLVSLLAAILVAWGLVAWLRRWLVSLVNW